MMMMAIGTAATATKQNQQQRQCQRRRRRRRCWLVVDGGVGVMELAGSSLPEQEEMVSSAQGERKHRGEG